MIAIEPITLKNVSHFKTVRLRALKDTPQAFSATYAKESQFDNAEWIRRTERMNGDRGIGFVALDGDNACGIVGAFLDTNDATQAQLVSMWTAPTHRQRGVGRLLVNEILGWARSREVRILLLMVTPNNEQAMRFYEGWGSRERVEPNSIPTIPLSLNTKCRGRSCDLYSLISKRCVSIRCTPLVVLNCGRSAADGLMDFSLSDHQKLIRDTVRQFMEAEVRPFVKEWEKQEKFPAETIQKLGEMGCCGMLAPEEWGGPGLDTISYVLMLEEVARVFTAMSTALSVTNSAVQAPLLAFGSEAQKKKYLRRMATGETLGAFCLTEPAAGSDAAGIQARAVREGGSYKLNGTKTWVTNGHAAGVLIVFAKTDPAAGGKGISAFLVEPSFQGFKVGRHEDKMGQRSSPSVEILLNDCIVPVENRLGEEGQGLKIALSALDGGRIGIAAQAVGLAQGALEEAIKYAKQRKAFGKNLGEFQAIQWMIADMQTEIEAARGLTHYAAWLKDAHPTKMGAAASKAKLYASEMVNRVVYKAVQVHGSVGYSRETEVERMYRDARVITIYEGTSEVQRMIIARELLGAPEKQKVAAN